MSSLDRADRRLLRRELHRSRSAPAVVVLVVIAIVSAWFAVECALRLLDRPALLARPGAVIDGAVAAVQDPTDLVVAIGAAALLLGLVLVVLALSPGRRSRHVLDDDRVLVIAEDAVIASALARTARTAAALGPDRAQAWVARRRAQVRLVPTAGVEVPETEVRTAVGDAVEHLRIQPPVRVSVSRSAQEKIA